MTVPAKKIIDALPAKRRAKLDRRFDQRLDELGPLLPPNLTPKQIASLRRKSRLDRPAFARHLGVGADTVKRWESGATSPRGMALKLLAVVQKHGLRVLG